MCLDGNPRDITDMDIIAMMQPGGIIAEFIELGGIFIVQDTNTNPIIVTSPEGFEFIGVNLSH